MDEGVGVGIGGAGPVAGEHGVVEGPIGHAGLPIVPGELADDLAVVLPVEGEQRLGDVLMQVGALRRVHRLVQVLLHHVVAEGVGRQALLADAPHARARDQRVASIEAGAQGGDDLPRFAVDHPSDDLGDEDVPFDAGRLQQSQVVRLKPGDALGHHAFHSLRKGRPIDPRPGDPPAFIVLEQVAALAHGAEQFRQEDRMALGSVAEGLAEGVVESVGFGVEDGVDEGAGFLGGRRRQVDRPLAGVAFHLVEHRFERVPVSVAALSHDVRPVSAEDQDGAVGDAPAEMEEQTGRGRVGPVQVIERDEERLRLRQVAQEGGVFLVDAVGGKRRRFRPGRPQSSTWLLARTQQSMPATVIARTLAGLIL